MEGKLVVLYLCVCPNDVLSNWRILTKFCALFWRLQVVVFLTVISC